MGCYEVSLADTICIGTPGKSFCLFCVIFLRKASFLNCGKIMIINNFSVVKKSKNVTASKETTF